MTSASNASQCSISRSRSLSLFHWRKKRVNRFISALPVLFSPGPQPSAANQSRHRRPSQELIELAPEHDFNYRSRPIATERNVVTLVDLGHAEHILHHIP